METIESLQTAQTIGAVVESATTALNAVGVATARLDAEVLLADACAMDRAGLYTRWREVPPTHVGARFDRMLSRRLRREPLQYIIGHQEFWSLDFAVTPDVLIPRPETELLVELAGTLMAEVAADNLRLCDLGTGSGCIAVALARELPRATVLALDISEAALAVARANARRHGVADRIGFVASSGLSAVRGSRFDAIISNPPYLCSRELGESQPELAWEPPRALDGGDDGLAVIERVLAEAPAYLNEGGWLLMEIGADQGPAVERLARAAAFSAVSIVSDYAGLPRLLRARR